MEDIFLETERLYLRKMSDDDFADVAEMLLNPDVMYAWEYEFSSEDVFEWISKNENLYSQQNLGYFLVFDKIENKCLGQAALMQDKIDGITYYEIGYIFKSRYWHMGYAAEAARGLVDYAFNKLNLNEVIFEIRPENIPSRKVAERLGAELCGSFNKNVRNKVMEHLIYKIKRRSF